jgi:hypothetical protein
MLTQRLIGWPTDGCGLRPGTALNDVLQLDIVDNPWLSPRSQATTAGSSRSLVYHRMKEPKSESEQIPAAAAATLYGKTACSGPVATTSPED